MHDGDEHLEVQVRVQRLAFRLGWHYTIHEYWYFGNVSLRLPVPILNDPWFEKQAR